MFTFWKSLDQHKAETKIKDLESQKDTLQAERDVLKEKVGDLKLKAKHEEEDIKHLVKMTQEKQAIESERKEMARDKDKPEEIAKVKDEYRNKLEKDLRDRGDEIRGMCTEILGRLPNITAKLKGDI